ncbi:unnamed protein product [Polarella glacialis]|uniref:Phosphodiesterase n=1 Tax=Polarella glacialis TaxID=89957 RepID=A0A813CYX0_POLGL|nr:unnamed protein product [Polarella glacialis]|mmetsp:Transcript_48482/g.87107  ORF Transcript_48482/g.87107 Transcript_48482/m.87107 type:complete len:527 (-) Transcript_48482:132-1712(-)
MGNAHSICSPFAEEGLAVIGQHEVAGAGDFIDIVPKGLSPTGGRLAPVRSATFGSLSSLGPVGHVASSDLDSQGLGQMCDAFELMAKRIAVRYRQSAQLQGSEAELQIADGVLGGVAHQLRRLQHFKLRSNTWQGGEAARWLNIFTGNRKRFKNLAEIVRKVQVENRIVKHWQGHALLGDKDPGSCQSLCSSPWEVPGSGKLDIDSWDGVDVFQLDKECQQPLAQVFMAIWQTRKLGQLCKAKPHKVLDYITAVESSYKQNPYHNRLHAAEVTLSSYYFWSSLSEQPGFQDYFTEVDLLVWLVSTAVHDIGHPAVNNDFLVKTKSSLALRYHDRAVLENFHIATAFELMKEKGVALLDHNMPSPPSSSLRNRVVEIILATDMAVHKSLVEDFAKEVQRNKNRQDIDKLLLEKTFVHMADIGHPLRPVVQHQEWATRVTQEFFAQGDREKDLGFTPIPLFDREKATSMAKSQIGFLNFVVAPTWAAIATLLGTAALAPQICLQDNLRVWKAMAEEEDAVAKASAGGS